MIWTCGRPCSKWKLMIAFPYMESHECGWITRDTNIWSQGKMDNYIILSNNYVHIFLSLFKSKIRIIINRLPLLPNKLRNINPVNIFCCHVRVNFGPGQLSMWWVMILVNLSHRLAIVCALKIQFDLLSFKDLIY